MELLQLIDIAGIAAFSISGAFAAMEKKLDVFGVFIIAFITALGGGTLRDVLIGDVPVSWMYNLNYGVIVLISTVAAMLFTNVINNYRRILLAFDSLGLGFFTVLGIEKGINLELHPAICITLGTITACFGGVIRDI
ncbi:MAG TPA: TRIC cation channel family protein, partial [Chitinophagales bacterium]|nr:TRIC cation channel family protein [Chitinophagales bacterium]